MDKSKVVTRNKHKTRTSTSLTPNKKSESPKGKIDKYIITRSHKPAGTPTKNEKENSPSLKQTNLHSFITKLSDNKKFNSLRDKLSVKELTKKGTNKDSAKNRASKKTVQNKSKNVTEGSTVKSTKGKSNTKTVKNKSKKATRGTVVKSIKDNSKTKNEVNSLYLSPSFKLHKQVPKVEDILRSIEESKKFEKVKELIDKSAEKFLKDLKVKEEIHNKPNKKIKLMDCKNISLRDLERRFNYNSEYLDNIFHGKVYNERHEKFKKETLANNNLTEDDLRVNETTSVFTDEQLIYIVSLFRTRYDNGNIYKNSDYYFKVLLPEFCLKIFLDYHFVLKNRENAMQYLKSLPVPNNLGL